MDPRCRDLLNHTFPRPGTTSYDQLAARLGMSRRQYRSHAGAASRNCKRSSAICKSTSNTAVGHYTVRGFSIPFDTESVLVRSFPDARLAIHLVFASIVQFPALGTQFLQSGTPQGIICIMPLLGLLCKPDE